MNITTENVLGHELIGRKAEVLDSADPTLRHLSGTIIFETKNMLTIRLKDCSKERHFAKKTAKKISIQTESGVCFISGSSMTGRPEDRISRLK